MLGGAYALAASLYKRRGTSNSEQGGSTTATDITSSRPSPTCSSPSASLGADVGSIADPQTTHKQQQHGTKAAATAGSSADEQLDNTPDAQPPANETACALLASLAADMGMAQQPGAESGEQPPTTPHSDLPEHEPVAGDAIAPAHDRPNGQRSAEAKTRRRKAAKARKLQKLATSAAQPPTPVATAAPTPDATATEAALRAALHSKTKLLALERKRARRDISTATQRARQQETAKQKARARKKQEMKARKAAFAARRDDRRAHNGKRKPDELLHSGSRKAQRLADHHRSSTSPATTPRPTSIPLGVDPTPQLARHARQAPCAASRVPSFSAVNMAHGPSETRTFPRSARGVRP